MKLLVGIFTAVPFLVVVFVFKSEVCTQVNKNLILIKAHLGKLL